MENVDLEIWWSSLPISEKERIALKGLRKAGGPRRSTRPARPGGTPWKKSVSSSFTSTVWHLMVMK